MLNLFLLAISLFVVVKSAGFCIRYASRLSQALHLPRYAVGFLVVAVISILPETFIAIDSSIRGIPSFGLGTLFGSNVADLTLIIGIIVFATARGIKVRSKILKDNRWYPFLLALPIFFGFDGYYSRMEGLFLIAAGLFFLYWTFSRNRQRPVPTEGRQKYPYQDFFYLILSMGAMLLGSHLTVNYGVGFSEFISINPALIGMLIVGLGTTLPELFFSLKAIKEERDDLALGDILGTVICDATIVVGILAMISPFYFSQKIIYITAAFMVLASLVLFKFMRSEKILSKKEGFLLFLFYAAFVITEFMLNK